MSTSDWIAPPGVGLDKAGDEDAIPNFPMHCLPGAAGAMAEEIARVTTSQSNVLAGASVLGFLSAAVGAGFEIGTGAERVTKPNLFVMIIAQSGTGKGEAFKLAGKPFEDAEAREIERFEMLIRPGLISELSVAEKRAKRLCTRAAQNSDLHLRNSAMEEYKKAEEERVALQRKLESAPRYKVGDVTKEALAMVMQGQPGEAVASLSSEARGIFSIVKGRYGKEGGDEDFYCSAYSGDSLAVDRVGRPRVVLRKPCLSVLWMVQPDAARRAFGDETLTESGLLPRFLIVDPKVEPKERQGEVSGISKDVMDGWNSLVGDLLIYRRGGEEPMRATASAEAAAILQEYENECIRARRRGGALHDMAPYVARWSENAWKVALVLHAARHGGLAHSFPLAAETARDAVELVKWFSERQLEVLSAGRTEMLRKRLVALLAVLTENAGEVSLRELRRSHAFDESEVRRLYERFGQSFQIVEKRGTGGRPSMVATTKRPLEDV
ncbi:YfjI family protein [Luteolibacter sp. GHJ8]|uniref:YfjI family protein n=1 Tax=Luteolibacter rhizosphaerae TaxID=2989719 RepID=A0ABT3GBQ1_9BACT|nr:YfjI family protein [Luteolibacter rhizosphaerae]MCW1916904.1 YfjI family protein [Luteolibacter rhizosphaerae]